MILITNEIEINQDSSYNLNITPFFSYESIIQFDFLTEMNDAILEVVVHFATKKHDFILLNKEYLNHD